MQLDSALDLYVKTVTNWWAWSIRLLRRGPQTTAEDMADAFARAGLVPSYKA